MQQSNKLNNILSHGGYFGTVEADIERKILFGRIVGINDIISYEGKDIESLTQDFHEAIAHYLSHCELIGKKAEKSFSGKILLRIPPELHSQIALNAKVAHSSINSLITSAIESFINKDHCRA